MNLIQRIDALLPQTQCGKCGHPGCQPYAEGIAQGEAINKCPPGGAETIAGLAELLNVAVVPLDDSRGLAPAQVAFIREAECIGCTKCIQACPVDAIVGAAKLMHTVLSDECTGCDLCVAPCPVDCIDMLPLPQGSVALVGDPGLDAARLQARTLKRNHARQRHDRRNARLRHEQEQRLARAARAPALAVVQPSATPLAAAGQDSALKQARITLSMSRAQLNKSLKAFGHPPTYEQAMRLLQLKDEVEAAEQALSRLEQTPDTPARPQATATSTGPATTAALKRAKVELAMARASLNKAQAAGASAEQLEALTRRMNHAEQAVKTAEQP